MTPGVDALHKLTNLGYQVRVEGRKIHLHYKGPGNSDPAKVKPILIVIEAYKGEVLSYLARSKTPNPPERILSCNECPWHQANPWTHYPELPAWCDWHFDHLGEDNPACIGHRRGELPKRRERRKRK